MSNTWGHACGRKLKKLGKKTILTIWKDETLADFDDTGLTCDLVDVSNFDSTEDQRRSVGSATGQKRQLVYSTSSANNVTTDILTLLTGE
jgi:hypothetical protein